MLSLGPEHSFKILYPPIRRKVVMAAKPITHFFRSGTITVKSDLATNPTSDRSNVAIMERVLADIDEPTSPTTMATLTFSQSNEYLEPHKTGINSTASSVSESRFCDNTELPFYFKEYSLQPTAKEILLQQPVVDKLLESHIKEMRDRAWRLFPYPCVGMYEYVRFNLPSYPLHRELLQLIRDGGKFLDVGCCFGQDIRYLRAQTGIDARNLYGADLRQEFINMGYDLFLDRDTLPSKIRQADIFDDNCWMYQELSSEVSVIHLGYVLHLFNYSTQVDMVKRMMRLLNKKPGNMVVGRSVGAEVPGHYMHPTVGQMYRHSMITFQELWEENAGCKVAVYLHMGKARRVSADGKQVFEHPPTERAVELEFCVLIIPNE